MPAPEPAKQTVGIIGAGAAGVSAAYALSLSPSAFSVSIFDPAPTPGGVASSTAIPPAASRCGYINYGVQGGTPSYRNTLALHERFGFAPAKVRLRVRFGRGATAWGNERGSGAGKDDVIARCAGEVRRFGVALRVASALEPLSVFVPIGLFLTLGGFSATFRNHVVYPLVALFFGTGNQTSSVSAAVVARVFNDPELRLFDYDEERFLSQSPEMFAFGRLDEIYGTILRGCGAESHLGNRVMRVAPAGSGGRGGMDVLDWNGVTHRFDRVVFACDAQTALHLLGPHASYLEKKVLGNVEFFEDVTISHTDEDYMRKHYDFDTAASSSEDDAKKARPMYYVETNPRDPSRITMSFDLAAYQPQFDPAARPVKSPAAAGTDGGEASNAGTRAPEAAAPIYQTIFLDKGSAGTWSAGEIDPEKVVGVHWWRQMAHTWRHFAFVVPFVRFIQGLRGKTTWFCGSYTMFNTHEAAVMSGLAAAYRLGAPYPFKDDPLAKKQFELYLSVVHGVRLKE